MGKIDKWTGKEALREELRKARESHMQLRHDLASERLSAEKRAKELVTANQAYRDEIKRGQDDYRRHSIEIDAWRLAARGVDAEIQRLRVMASVEIKPVQMSAVLRRKLIKQVESPHLRQLMGLPPKVIPK